MDSEQAEAPWPAGFHTTTVAELNQRCVTAFPGSETRRTIWRGLIHIINVARGAGLQGELWIGGGFTTSASDPAGAEVVLRLKTQPGEGLSRRQREAIDFLGDDLGQSHSCETFTFSEFPSHHPLHEQSVYWYTFWSKQLISAEDPANGIAVLELGGSGRD